MGYEGGYTSALDSASVRELQRMETMQRQQEMRQRAVAFQQQQDAVRRRLLARQQLGDMLPELGAMGGQPPGAGGPQPPMPGASSPPMLPPPPQGGMLPPPQGGMPSQMPPQQPPGMPPGGGGMPMPPPAGAGPSGPPPPMPQGAGPGAPPSGPPGGAPGASAPGMPPQPWKALPKPPEPAGGAPGALPPPPSDGAVMPRELVSVADMAKLLKSKGIKGEAALDMLEEWKPFMDDQNKRQFDSMKIAFQAQSAAMKAYETTMRTLTAQQRADEQGRHNRTEEGIQRDRNAAIRARRAAAGGAGAKPTWSKATIDYYAERALAGDNTWRTGLSRTSQGATNISAVDDRVADMSAERGSTAGGDITNRAVRGATEKALTERTKFVAAGQQFVRNFQKQADLVEKYLGTGAAGSTPIINKWIQKGRKAVEGDPDVTAFDTAIRGLAREHQRIVTGVTSNAQLHVSAQETADELLNKDMTPDQVRATLKVMREEATNAVDSGQEEVGALKSELKTIGAAPAKGGDAPPAGIPAGSKAIGWSKDATPKRVWQSPDGKKWTE